MRNETERHGDRETVVMKEGRNRGAAPNVVTRCAGKWRATEKMYVDIGQRHVAREASKKERKERSLWLHLLPFEDRLTSHGGRRT